MLKRTLFLTSPGAVSIKLAQLIFDGAGGRKSAPVEDLGFVVIENRQISMTGYALQQLSANGVAVVFCDEKHMPDSMIVSFSGHTLTQRVVARQLSCGEALRKRLWKQTVSAKVFNQGRCLQKLGKNGELLLKLSRKVKSGDPENIEGAAAREYFKTISENFVRDRERDGINSALNYGYAIIRAATARALVGSGLLCVRGIHHSNQYNSFALADDVMEPYRPWVDELVFGDEAEFLNSELGREGKMKLLSLLAADVTIGRTRRPLMNALSITSASLVKCFDPRGEGVSAIAYPEFTG